MLSASQFILPARPFRAPPRAGGAGIRSGRFFYKTPIFLKGVLNKKKVGVGERLELWKGFEPLPLFESGAFNQLSHPTNNNS